MQIVGFKWKSENEWQPYLLLADGGGEIEQLELFNHKIKFRLGQRRCAGYWTNGKYVPCERKALLAPRCMACRLSDDWARCIECSGTCLNPAKRDSCATSRFVIYLATFGPLLKVGISRVGRTFERLIEQGADLGCLLVEMTDGSLVRRVEQKIASILDCTDRVNGKTKASYLVANPNTSAIALGRAITVLVDNDALNGTKINPSIYDFRKYYRLDMLEIVPKDLISPQPGLELSGEVIAAKGNLLVLANDNGTCLLNGHELIGYEIETNF